MQTTLINTRLKIPASLYRRLRHLAVDRGQHVSELLVEAAENLLERSESEQEAAEGQA